ncbi:hypothetical protein [Sphingomonas phyllosphaerae]|uniref:hypothetical protein n=1 Tax=Sphingomonas phyllosphaerae TaxID=257003 RepID=UPI0003F9CB5F|nr:hypothetical protein [Sphingomonas phyllosphaerae]
MLLRTIDPATATALPLGGLADDLDLLIGDLESRFRAVGETLASTINTVDRMATGLDEVQRALSPEVAGAAVDKLRQAAHRLGTLPQQRRQRAGQIGALTLRTRELRELLSDVAELLRTLSIYGMNIKIASSGEMSFVQFATGMEGKLDSGRRELKQFEQELASFGTVVRDVKEADDLLADECRKVPATVPGELSGNADVLERHLESTAKMARDVRAIMQKVQAEVARILGAIQVGDSVRQRVEHCAAILRAAQAEPNTPGASAHLSRLVAAQMAGIAEDFRREMGALVGSLAQLGPLAEGLMKIVAAQAQGEESEALGKLQSGIAGLGHVTGRLSEADRQLEGLTAFVANTIADLSRGLGRIQRIAMDVQDISTNTRLLCRRHGIIGRAVAVIATEVNPCATRLTRLSSDIERVVQSLGMLDLRPEGAGGAGGSTGALDDALAVVRSACETSDHAMSSGGDEARRIIATLQEDVGALQHEQGFADQLDVGAVVLNRQAMATELSAADEEVLRRLLPWAAGLYTMASEREIHAGFLLPGMEQPAAPPPPAFDDDDDGLF